MYEGNRWEGIAPSPQVLGALDFEQMSVLAFLAWCSGTKNKPTAQDVANLVDRDGKPLGMAEAREIVQELMDLKIMSVRGMHGESPLSILLGGFQRTAPYMQRPGIPASNRTMRERYTQRTATPERGAPVARRPQIGAPRKPEPTLQPQYKTAEQGILIENAPKGLPNLLTTSRTPAFVPMESQILRERQLAVETGAFEGDLVEKAEERLKVLNERIRLYDRWLRMEPSHKMLEKYLERKKGAVSELEFQLERAKVKAQGEEAA